jgi:hypothetical protein
MSDPAPKVTLMPFLSIRQADRPGGSENAAIGACSVVKTTLPAENTIKSAAEEYLRSSYSSFRFNVIIKPTGDDWRSLQRSLAVDEIARLVAEGSSIIGIRPEKQTRLVIIDIDNKPDRSSPYWHPTGQSKELLKLQEVIEGCGCAASTLVSSRSRGLHVYVALPEWMPAYKAHWIGRELLRRAGIAPAAGEAELFPSEMPYHPGEPSERPQSNGVRLPGQDGCALVAGDRTLTDATLIFRQLQCDLEETQNCLTFKELVADADNLRKQRKQCSKVLNSISTFKRFDITVEWTDHGQSNLNLGTLTTQARVKYKPATPQELAAIVEELALRSPGFDRFASAETKKDLKQWCKDWANCSFRKEWTADGKTTSLPKSTDPNRNERLLQEAKDKLTALKEAHGIEAKDWSQREVARQSGLSRNTVRKHWGHWVLLHQEVVHTPPYKGAEPGERRGEPGGEPKAGEPCQSVAGGGLAEAFASRIEHSREILEQTFKISPGRRYLTREEMIKMTMDWMMDDDFSDFLQDDRSSVEKQC